MTAADNLTITSGGVVFDAAWLRCRVRASRRKDELIVSVPGVPDAVTAPAFFVDPTIVQTESTARLDQDVDGVVKVLLLEQREQEAVVEVPGEPVSYGPKLLVPLSLLS